MVEQAKLANLKNVKTGELYPYSMVCHVNEDRITFVKNNGMAVDFPLNEITEVNNDTQEVIMQENYVNTSSLFNKNIDTDESEPTSDEPIVEMDDTPVPTPSTPKEKTKYVSKKALAQQLYETMPDATRKEVIAELVKLGLAKNSASIYHNKIWVTRKKDLSSLKEPTPTE